MSKKFSRRDFLKVAGAGAATSAVLTGCGPASRYVTREQYLQMPEYTLNGQSTYFATTCRECAAGCGFIVRTFQGRALKVEGNPDHPVNLGKTCSRGQITLQGLYNPDRVEGPIQQARGNNDGRPGHMEWDAAVQIVAEALKNNQPSEIAFLMGMAPDHLFDLVADLAAATGINAPVRYSALSTFETRATLVKAAENILGQAALPFFDLGGADVVFSFGANFLETWLSPVSFTRGFMNMRKGTATGKRGTFVQFEPRMSQTASKADEWIPVAPGTEGMVALAIGKLAAEMRGGAMPLAFEGVSIEDVATRSGVSLETLEHLAGLFAGAGSALAIPGGAALAQTNGLANAEAVLALNALADNAGKPGGVFFTPASPLPSEQQPASMQQLQEFVQQMADGKFKVLFVHGVNPAFDLPAALDFAGASANVGQIISFATYPDETAMLADYIFPDHHGLESWGYQRVATGVAQSTLSGAQPVVVPFHDTRSTVDVLLAAAQAAGGDFAATLPFGDEVAFIQNKVSAITGDTEGSFTAPDLPTFMAYFQQHGGWWKTVPSPMNPSAADTLSREISVTEPAFAGEGEFVLLPFMSPTLGDNGANKPWLQELADPTTTVMWGTWVEMNPRTAEELGIVMNDVLRITSEAGEVEVPVYLYPAIRPDVIAMPFGQGHTAYGRFAAGRGVNPLKLISPQFNEAGDLAFAGMKVKVEKTGENRPLSRLEGAIGVYGFDAKQ